MPSSPGKHNRTSITLFVLRIIIGIFLIYHGVEVFDVNKIAEYATWVPRVYTFLPETVAYIGKATELVSGIMLLLGLATRVAAGLVVLTFLFIVFKLGEGRILMQEQHPFMFVLFGLLFLVEGGGRWSLDHYVKNLRRDRRP